jgi:polyhydroxyalkanoate synthesis regulator phasin
VQDALATMRERLTRGVVVTADAIQEAFDEAVKRGRMTRPDAQETAADLVTRGRRQAEEFLAEVERLLGRGRAEVGSATADTRRRVADAGDRVAREVDRARRAARIPGFPIMGYESLTAAQITARISDLSPAELRKVRDHERRNANRKSVLQAIEKRLS